MKSQYLRNSFAVLLAVLLVFAAPLASAYDTKLKYADRRLVVGASVMLSGAVSLGSGSSSAANSKKIVGGLFYVVGGVVSLAGLGLAADAIAERVDYNLIPDEARFFIDVYLERAYLQLTQSSVGSKISAPQVAEVVQPDASIQFNVEPQVLVTTAPTVSAVVIDDITNMFLSNIYCSASCTTAEKAKLVKNFLDEASNRISHKHIVLSADQLGPIVDVKKNNAVSETRAIVYALEIFEEMQAEGLLDGFMLPENIDDIDNAQKVDTQITLITLLQSRIKLPSLNAGQVE